MRIDVLKVILARMKIESGQYYPNDKGCEYDDYVLLEDRPGKMDRCAYLGYLCGEDGEIPGQ
jgi:hypothetical protein